MSAQTRTRAHRRTHNAHEGASNDKRTDRRTRDNSHVSPPINLSL